MAKKKTTKKATKKVTTKKSAVKKSTASKKKTPKKSTVKKTTKKRATKTLNKTSNASLKNKTKPSFDKINGEKPFEFENSEFFSKAKDIPELPDFDSMFVDNEVTTKKDIKDLDAISDEIRQKLNDHMLDPTPLPAFESVQDIQENSSFNTDSFSSSLPTDPAQNFLPLKESRSSKKSGFWGKLFGKNKSEESNSSQSIVLKSVKKEDGAMPEKNSSLPLTPDLDLGKDLSISDDFPSTMKDSEKEMLSTLPLPLEEDPFRKKVELDALHEAHKKSHAREKESLENKKRALDHEYKERFNHIQEVEEAHNQRKSDLDDKEKELETREKDLLSREKELGEFQQLKELVENTKISLVYEKQRVEELKSELALKDSMLKEKEIELDKREEALKKLEQIKQAELKAETENEHLKQEVQEEDDAIIYLQQEIEKQRKQFEDQLKQFQLQEVQDIDRFTKINQLITQCYLEISQKDLAQVKAIYTLIRDEYDQIKDFDTDKTVYKEIVKLFEDVKAKF